MLRKMICVLCLILLAGAMTGCASEEEYTTYYFDYFDTFSSLTVYAPNAETAAKYDQIVNEVFRQYHELCNTHAEFPGVTNLYTVNQAAGGDPVVIPPELYDFLEFCLDAYEISSHTVNIALGPVTRLWNEQLNSDTPQYPDHRALTAASMQTSPINIILDPEQSTVLLKYSGMALDVGALAKGYAVGIAEQRLREAGCKRAILNAGGNVLCIGSPPGYNSWTVGIRNPQTDSEVSLYTTWKVKDACAVTSGDYERYFELDGVRYHHIIDPSTLCPGTRYHSVSVRCSDAAIADLLSTALFLLPEDEGRALAAEYDADVLYIYPDYSSSS